MTNTQKATLKKFFAAVEARKANTLAANNGCAVVGLTTAQRREIAKYYEGLDTRTVETAAEILFSAPVGAMGRYSWSLRGVDELRNLHIQVA